MNKTNINWCDYTLNIITGCTKIALGCKNCYAESIANRFWGGRKFTDVKFHEERLNDKKLQSKKPLRIFINSMGDTFHSEITDDQSQKILTMCEKYPQHTFLILSKRYRSLPDFSYPENVWLGYSASTQKDYNEGIEYLLKTDAKIKWASIEPQLESINLIHWSDLQWVVCGCESGIKRRMFDNKWAFEIAEYSDAGLPVWIKQIRDNNNKVIEDVNLFPKELQLRELPL